MAIFQRVLRRVLAGSVESLVREQLAEHSAAAGLTDADVSLYRHRVHGDRSRLHIDPTAVVNDALFNVSAGEITVGEHAFFGHGVSVLTGTHDISKFGRERQLSFPRDGRDVTIGVGVWLASQVIVLGPSVIGDHAVVAAGSLVIGDVEPYTVVAGRPAKYLRHLEPAPDAST